MKLTLISIKSILLLFFIFFSQFIYAEAGQYVGVTIYNNYNKEITLAGKTQFDRVGSLPDKTIAPFKKSRAHSKGLALRGPGGIYSYKISDNLYVDLWVDQYHYGYFEYELCFSSKLRIKGERYQTPEGKIQCVSDSSNSAYYAIKKMMLNNISVSIEIESKKSGAFKMYNSKEVYVKIEGDHCNKEPSYLNSKFSYVKQIKENDAIFAFYNYCIYYSYCPSDSKFCTFKKNGLNSSWSGDFYPIKSDVNLIKLFDSKLSNLKLAKELTYDKKPMMAGFTQAPIKWKIGDTVSASELYKIMQDADNDYCDLIKKKDKNAICYNPTYTMQPRLANQLKYINKEDLSYYECYINSLIYPNIGANICELNSIYTIKNGLIVKH